MASNIGISILIIGILLIFAGAAMPSEKTATATSCNGGYWIGDSYVEGNCYESEVTTNNPAKGAVTGLGVFLGLIGFTTSVVSGNRNWGGTKEPKRVNHKNSSQTSSTNPLIRVYGDVINAETNESESLSLKIRTDNVASAKGVFRDSIRRDGYVLNGELSVEVIEFPDTDGVSEPSTVNSASNIPNPDQDRSSNGSTRGDEAKSPLESTAAETIKNDNSPHASTTGTAPESRNRNMSSDSHGEDDTSKAVWDIPINVLVYDQLSNVDHRVWKPFMLVMISVYGLQILAPSLIPDGAVFYLILFGTPLFLPISLYMDATYVAQTTEWTPKRTRLSVLAILPILNVIVGMYYLFRCYQIYHIGDTKQE